MMIIGITKPDVVWIKNVDVNTSTVKKTSWDQSKRGPSSIAHNPRIYIYIYIYVSVSNMQSKLVPGIVRTIYG